MAWSSPCQPWRPASTYKEFTPPHQIPPSHAPVRHRTGPASSCLGRWIPRSSLPHRHRDPRLDTSLGEPRLAARLQINQIRGEGQGELLHGTGSIGCGHGQIRGERRQDVGEEEERRWWRSPFVGLGGD